MSRFDVPDHDDVAAVLVTGCHPRNAGKNRDTPEERQKFIEDHYPEFARFAIDGDPDIIENFVSDPSMRYRDWLN